MAADASLAILHHLVVFLLFATLAAELVLVRPGIDRATLRRVAAIDRAYGGLAAAAILVGVARVVWGLRGWEFYVASPFFWAKMAAFAAAGLLSIPPTMKFLAWARMSDADPAFTVPQDEIGAARRLIHLQAGVFLLIIVFAALMARGIGY